MADRETELKYELSEAAYHALLAARPVGGAPAAFSNAYFTTEGEQPRRDWVLRLRQRPGETGGELTLKVGRQLSPGSFSSMEYSARVSSDQPADWEETEPLRVFREEISRQPLLCRGRSDNERRLVRAPLGPVPLWEVDRTSLPNGKLFHELEIEFPPDRAPTPELLSGFRAQLEEWMFQQELPAVPSRKTKYRRFLEAIGAHF
jgi:hypothetical protein